MFLSLYLKANVHIVEWELLPCFILFLYRRLVISPSFLNRHHFVIPILEPTRNDISDVDACAICENNDIHGAIIDKVIDILIMW
jgi:hypothetical protein